MPWQAAVDPSIEICAIQLPGHGARLGQRAYVSLPDLVVDLAKVLALDEELPFAFFGHSLGALIAFETALQLQREGMPMPQQLFVSACAAPRHRSPSQRMHALPDAGLIQKLKDYNGTPVDILANKELMDLVLPSIRADLAMTEEYAYTPGPLLDIPITAFTGKKDGLVSLSQAEGWGDETRGPCSVAQFEGAHFFIHSEMRAVIERVTAGLEETTWVL